MPARWSEVPVDPFQLENERLVLENDRLRALSRRQVEQLQRSRETQDLLYEQLRQLQRQLDRQPVLQRQLDALPRRQEDDAAPAAPPKAPTARLPPAVPARALGKAGPAIGRGEGGVVANPAPPPPRPRPSAEPHPAAPRPPALLPPFTAPAAAVLQVVDSPPAVPPQQHVELLWREKVRCAAKKDGWARVVKRPSGVVVLDGPGRPFQGSVKGYECAETGARVWDEKPRRAEEGVAVVGAGEEVEAVLEQEEEEEEEEVGGEQEVGKGQWTRGGRWSSHKRRD